MESTTLPPVDATRVEALWAEEVARVLASAQSFAPAVRAILRQVLTSLATEPDSRPDTQVMLEALSQRNCVGLAEVA